jgi:hypothetical protein
MKNGLRILMVAAALVLVLERSGSATSFISQPFPKTVQDAPVIVRGKVISSHADWSKDSRDGKRIYTFTELQLTEVIKGTGVSGPGVQVRELGGEKDGVGMQVAGASVLNPGEDVVLMLGPRNSDGSFDVRGLMMGKLSVKRDSSGNELLTGPAVDFQSDEIIGAQDDPQAKKTWSLAELRKLVAAVAPSPVPTQIHTDTPPTPAVHPTSQATAPALQPSRPQEPPESPASEPEESGSGFLLGKLAIAVAVLGGLGTWWIARSKK